MIITIDGPAASGKGTAARKLANVLRYYYINTGLLYRAISCVLLTRFDYTQDTIACPNAEHVDAVSSLISYHYDPTTRETISVQGSDITSELKTPLIDLCASRVSTDAYVREVVMKITHELVNKHDAVIDARDAGSRVFPNAEHKFFLTASVEARAQRWQKDQKKKGNVFTLEQAKKALVERDSRDKTRALAPLVVPKGAVVVDNSDVSIEGTVALLLKSIKKGKP